MYYWVVDTGLDNIIYTRVVFQTNCVLSIPANQIESVIAWHETFVRFVASEVCTFYKRRYSALDIQLSVDRASAHRMSQEDTHLNRWSHNWSLNYVFVHNQHLSPQILQRFLFNNFKTSALSLISSIVRVDYNYKGDN